MGWNFGLVFFWLRDLGSDLVFLRFIVIFVWKGVVSIEYSDNNVCEVLSVV